MSIVVSEIQIILNKSVKLNPPILKLNTLMINLKFYFHKGRQEYVVKLQPFNRGCAMQPVNIFSETQPVREAANCQLLTEAVKTLF